MNEAFDCYGEQRLAKVLEQYAHLPFEQLRSFIFADLRAFAGARRSARRHDDDHDEGRAARRTRRRRLLMPWPG